MYSCWAGGFNMFCTSRLITDWLIHIFTCIFWDRFKAPTVRCNLVRPPQLFKIHNAPKYYRISIEVFGMGLSLARSIASFSLLIVLRFIRVHHENLCLDLEMLEVSHLTSNWRYRSTSLVTLGQFRPCVGNQLAKKGRDLDENSWEGKQPKWIVANTWIFLRELYNTVHIVCIKHVLNTSE